MRKIFLLASPPLPWAPFWLPALPLWPPPFLEEPPSSAAWAAEITPRSRPVTELTASGTASMANMVPPARISFLKLYVGYAMYLSIFDDFDLLRPVLRPDQNCIHYNCRLAGPFKTAIDFSQWPFIKFS